ncbi:MAG: hypothetical protein Crog4KO_19250 [Crocinitomicaceae bacterium]
MCEDTFFTWCPGKPKTGIRVGIETTNCFSMKTKALLFTFLASASVSFAQVEVDSSFIVRDTLTVEEDARVGHNLEVDEDALVRHDLEVEGTTDINNLNVLGTTTLKYLESPLPSDTFGILVATSNGTVMRSGPGALFPVPQEPIGFCDIYGNPYSNNPYWVSQPERLYTACPDVFVGIGIENPRVNLDVNGTSFSQELALSTDPLNMAGAKLKIGGYSPQINTNLVSISNSTEGIFQLSNQGSLHLKGNIDLNSDHNEPLIISNSTEKILQLNSDGTLRSRAVKVNVYQWPDYVFEPSYDLMDLNEVEEFIDENGHLPNVPSAEELDEDGLDLYEMNKILMEKVEELTLHIIEQNKRIEELEEKE